MAIRFDSGDSFGVPSGYEGANTPEGFALPSVGVEDVDRAMFDLFDRQLNLQIANEKSGITQKIPVIFAAGERWAMLKKNRALRDKSGTLILPLTTIRRMDIQQNLQEDISGRGINQQTGQLVIKRRLSPLDRAYQNIINKLNIVNQANVADSNATLLTDRAIGANASDFDVSDGALLAPKLENNNIWEVITIPSPQFFTVAYEVTFWTQHIQHMNQVIEKIMSSYLPTANGTFRIETPTGYWFVAKVVDNMFTAADNAENVTGEERVIKTKISMKVAAYAVATGAPGTPSPTRRFVSAPILTFPSGEGEQLISGMPTSADIYSGSDDPSAYFSLDGSVQPRERASHPPSSFSTVITKSPFSGRDRVEFVRVITRNSKNGEAILRPDDSLTVKIVSG